MSDRYGQKERTLESGLSDYCVAASRMRASDRASRRPSDGVASGDVASKVLESSVVASASVATTFDASGLSASRDASSGVPGVPPSGPAAAAASGWQAAVGPASFLTTMSTRADANTLR